MGLQEKMHATDALAQPRLLPSARQASKKACRFAAQASGKTVGEYDNGSASGKGRTEYIWLPTEDGSAIPIGFFRNANFFAVHTDHLGTPRLVTNENKRPVWQWPYSAFGNNKPSGVLKATPNPKAAITNKPVLLKASAPTEFALRHPGQTDDPELGMFNNGFRVYWPQHGRYPQPDPIGLRGALNRFDYGDQNALRRIDPLGLRSTGWGWLDNALKSPDTSSCVTAECAAGMLPAPSENRTQREIDQSLCEFVCGVAAPDDLIPTKFTIKKLIQYGAEKIASQSFCRWVCKDKESCK